MSTEIASTRAAEDLARLQARVTKTRTTTPSVGGIDFLRFGTDGVWVYGQENVETQPGSLWAIDPFSFRTGFVCWTDYPARAKRKNEKLGEMFAVLGSDPIDIHTLPQHAVPDEYRAAMGDFWQWKPASEMELTCITGEDKGKKVRYQTSSYGGLQLADEYLTKLDAQLTTDGGNPVAIVMLDHSTYTHKTYGLTYKPEIEIKSWVSLDATSLADDDGDGDEGGETPAIQPSAQPATVADEGPAPAPTRARRRPAVAE